MSQLRLWLLGPPYLQLDGENVHIGRRKAVALLAYLAVKAGRHSRDSLATLLWPEYDQIRARADLRRTLSMLNKTLGAGWLSADRETIGLSEAADLWLDVDEFHQLLVVCATHGHPMMKTCGECLPLLTRAVELYRDDFLAGFSLRDSLNFDEWQFLQTESLRQELAATLERLVCGYIDQDAYEPALTYARRWLALDPLHEPAHRILMQLYAQSGQWSAAARHYQECVRILEAELGVPPDAETIALYKRLRRELKGTGQKSAGYNLPPQSTSFIGREAELAELGRLLAVPNARLITLVGPGGIGKTRLALKVAAEINDMFADGVFFVALQPISSPDLLVSTIAESIGLSFHGQETPEAQLRRYLRDKELLLLLDNFEHLLPVSDLLSTILVAALKVKLLVTSREVLSLQEEWIWHVKGMDHPEIDQVEALETYGALKLFVERARQVQRTFSSQAERACMIRICRLVGGMPLAIELAAAWLKNLPCGKIAREIERNLDILSTNVRNIPERHRSMRAVLEHSWRLLDEEERRALKRLSVFRGGFRQAAAEEVAGASWLTLSSLVDKSLLRVTPSGRYEFHELLRQFADGRLEASAGEKEAVKDLHCAYFAEFLYRRQDDWEGSKQVEALEEVEAEIENLRLAWDHAITRGDLDALRKAWDILFSFHKERGWYLQGARTLELAIAKLRTSEASERTRELLGRLLSAQALFWVFLGQHTQAETLAQESLAIAHALGDREAMIGPVCNLGYAKRGQGDLREAERLFREWLEICKEFGYRSCMARALGNLGQTIRALGEYEEAESCLRKSLNLFKDLGDRWGEAWMLDELSRTACAQGSYQEARQIAGESLIITQQTHSRNIGLRVFESLGDAALALGKCEEAERFYEEGLAITQKAAMLDRAPAYLIGLADVACTLGKCETATGRYRESLAIAEQTGSRDYIARSHQGLGRVALHKSDHVEAQRQYQESLTHSRESGQRPLTASVLNDLGVVSNAVGKQLEARGLFQEALQTALEMRAMPILLESVVGIAQVIAGEGRHEQAAELFSLGRQHTASHATTKLEAERFLAELESEMAPAVFAAACHRGATSQLEKVAAALLAELARSERHLS